MRRRLALLAGMAAGAMVGLLAAPGARAEVPAVQVVSPGPRDVAVAIYRSPQRPAGAEMDRSLLLGYALVTETREVDLPAGDAVLRFEGVAGGMLAESVIVAGLPAGASEKNLDAQLLSPRNLYAGALGRPVTLRRTDPATGQAREEPAVIRSGADGAVVLQTAAGFEMAHCGPQLDALVYDGVPAGLNARPTLSVATRSPRSTHARITLTYLAWGFDWQADYVLRLAPGARRAQMSAWVTLASSDPTSFAQARAAVIAGKPRMTDTPASPGEAEALTFECRLAPPAPELDIAPPAPPAPVAAPMIMVTASRMAPMTVRPEALGDLKLYRVPVPTTIAAHGQKQVALLDRREVDSALVYKAGLAPGRGGIAHVALRLANRAASGLGMALPAGRVRVEQVVNGAVVPAATGRIEDKAVGEDIDVDLGAAGVVRVTALPASGKLQRWRISN
ncbi:MAG TPA: hypothetical protein VN222_11060, partial [Novosphingobium sp.]|nr:hypothetical protein [Novosphingobium sp.]